MTKKDLIISLQYKKEIFKKYEKLTLQHLTLLKRVQIAIYIAIAICIPVVENLIKTLAWILVVYLSVCLWVFYLEKKLNTIKQKVLKLDHRLYNLFKLE